MKFYDCAIAPNPRRARIFIAEKGLQVDKIEIDILGGENLQPAYQAINPRGLLPTLELDDGTRIDEVVAICGYLEALHPDPPLLGTTAIERARVESRQRQMEFDGMIAVSEIFRNSNPAFATRSLPGNPAGVAAIPALAERGRQTLERFFAALECFLSQGDFLCGDRFTLADITALCAIDFASWVHIGIPEQNRHTHRWYQSVTRRPSAKA